ncbi:MAG: TolC family protein [Anaerovoracaceae bacterium]
MNIDKFFKKNRYAGRRAAALCLCAALTAGSGLASVAFAASDTAMTSAAADSAAAETSAEEPAGTGEHAGSDADTSVEVSSEKTVTLTLEEAVTKMKTDSALSQQAEFNRRQDEITAKSYTETARSIKSSLEDISEASDLNTAYSLQQSGVTKSNQRIAELSRDFVNEHKDENYEAEMNGIEQSAVSQYYNILLDQEEKDLCESRLSYQKKLLSSAETKYSRGMISYDALVSQRNAAESAERNLRDAETALSADMRTFNENLGYDLDTRLVLTTPIEQTAEELPDVKDAVDSALENSLELKYYTDFTVKKLELQMNSLRYSTSLSSSSYKNAELSYEKSLRSIEEKKTAKEQSIRNAYDTLSRLDGQIEAAREALETAERSYASALKKYDLGLVSALSLQEAELSASSARQSLDSAIVSYNCAVTQLKGDTGAGSSRISFS